MRLSETERGAAWLDNFRPADEAIALDLLDAFVLVGWTEARVRLLQLLEAAIAEETQSGAIWVLPVLDRGDILKTADLGLAEKLTVFDNFSPGAPLSPLPGSEALVSHLVREVQQSRVMPPDASLMDLRVARVRAIFVVTDLVESGTQVLEFVAALLRNRSIRSWRSFGWTRVVAITYAVSAEALLLLEESPLIDEVRYVRGAPSIGKLPWPRKRIDDARELCRTYGRTRHPLGYKAHAGLFGFQDRVPNTVPMIFRQEGREWSPLFERRRVPPDLATELDPIVGPGAAHRHLLTTLRQTRLKAALDKQQHRGNKVVLAALAALLSADGRTHALASSLDLTQQQLTSLFTYMEAQGWITDNWSVTDAGRAELREAKRKPRRVEAPVPAAGATHYYPGSLR